MNEQKKMQYQVVRLKPQNMAKKIQTTMLFIHNVP